MLKFIPIKSKVMFRHPDLCSAMVMEILKQGYVIRSFSHSKNTFLIVVEKNDEITTPPDVLKAFFKSITGQTLPDPGAPTEEPEDSAGISREAASLVNSMVVAWASPMRTEKSLEEAFEKASAHLSAEQLRKCADKIGSERDSHNKNCSLPGCVMHALLTDIDKKVRRKAYLNTQ